MKSDYKKLLISQKLFDGCDEGMVENIVLSEGTLISFRSGEEMTPPSPPAVGILLSGRGVIYSADKDRHTILRFISPGNAVGVASLFAAKPPATRIYACGDGKSDIFFIARETFEKLLSSETDGRFRTNLICFLADRVSFLNSRIDTVTAGSSERKLALFIKNSPIGGRGEIELGMSMTALAHALDIGRASLYRAFESLERSGVIKRNGNVVFLLSRESLDEIC
ncbi:MAG: Crp/Fnr family transcriptional regulator [Clostridia bacterium]|nr:Crp/Fnr family transcriptional regulator [Clostridia bacterium]